MHFESLHFRSILILVPNLISCLSQSLKMKNMSILVPVVNPLTENFYMIDRVHSWYVKC